MHVALLKQFRKIAHIGALMLFLGPSRPWNPVGGGYHANAASARAAGLYSGAESSHSGQVCPGQVCQKVHAWLREPLGADEKASLQGGGTNDMQKIWVFLIQEINPGRERLG